MSTEPVPDTVGAFLKARRAQLTPEVVGLPHGSGARRVPGLRRAEVATLASISVEYYTRIEQNRVRVSGSVLETLVGALALDEDQQRYLFVLAGRPQRRPRRRTTDAPRPAMRRLLDQLTETPAMALGRNLEILAWNTCAEALYGQLDGRGAIERNYLWLLFADPDFRAMHLNWEHDARSAVGALRSDAAADPADPRLIALVGDLSLRDSDFRTWWAEHEVFGPRYGIKHYRHPVVGELTLDCDTWSNPDGSGQRLMVLTAEPGSTSHDALRILASWGAPSTERHAAGIHEDRR